MTIASTGTARTAPKFYTRGDLMAQMQFVRGIVGDGLRDGTMSDIDQAHDALVNYYRLQQLNLSNRLRGVPLTPDQSEYVLGADGKQLVQDLASVGVDLPTHERYYYSAQTFDAKGNLLASTPRTLATQADLDRIRQGQLDTKLSTPNDEVRVATVNGNQVVTHLDLKNTETTADRAQVDAAATAVDQKEDDDLATLNALARQMVHSFDTLVWSLKGFANADKDDSRLARAADADRVKDRLDDFRKAVDQYRLDVTDKRRDAQVRRERS
jgi:hypothetical protein